MKRARAIAEALRALANAVEAPYDAPAVETDAPRYYTRKSAAAAGIEGRVFDRAAAELGVKPGREILVKRSDLHAWIEAHPIRTKPTATDDAAAVREAEYQDLLASLARPRRRKAAR